MNALRFLRSPEAAAVLARAARAAGTPLSLHYVGQEEEGPLIQSWGACAACSLVNDHPDGRKRCRIDRTGASEKALKRGKPVRFLCHMGFVSVCVPAVASENFVLTFGPYCPTDESRTLEFDAIRGLAEATGQSVEQFPVSLGDIHCCPAWSVSSVAEWTVESLAALYADTAPSSGVDEDGEEGQVENGARPRRRKQGVPKAPNTGSDLAAAAAAGDMAGVRRLLSGVLATLPPRADAQMRQARILASVASALECAVRMQVSTARARAALPRLCANLDATDSIIQEATSVLAALRSRPAGDERDFPQDELYRLIQANLQTPPALTELARGLGVAPSTLTTRLTRQFGVTYTGYVARLRIARARELLRDTSLPVAEIARRVGISDESNLSRVFRRHEGMTPAQYRKAVGKTRK